MATCYRHPGRETNVGCSNCGRPICPDCMISTPVGMRCPECTRERTKVHRGPGAITSGAKTVTVGLITVNVLAFVAEMIGGGASSFEGGGKMIRDFGLFGPAIDAGDWYRIVTGGFLHAGALHLAFNMLALYILGSLLEPALGAWRFLGLYAAGLLGGAFGALLLDPNQITVGASGAVFGLMAAGFLIARHRGFDDVASQIGIFVVLNLVFTFSIPNISIGGHLGGLVAGGLAALAIAAGERRGGADGRAFEGIALTVLIGVGIAGSLLAASASV